MDPEPNRALNPATLAPPTGYSHVVEARGRRTIYISGQVALDPHGQLVGPNDLRAQAEQVFQNLQAALAAAGAGFDDVVKLTFYLVDMTQMQAVRDVRGRYLNPARLPASTAIEVRGLVRPEFLVEIDAIAVRAD